jgi:DNA-binding IclR family transcriptional regulator
MDVLESLAAAPDGATSSELAQRCGISTSTCALILTELEQGAFVSRLADRRYFLGSGLFGLVYGLRARYPLLDVGRAALEGLYEATGAACSLTKIEADQLTVVDICGHDTEEQYAVGQQFPIDPPFGSVAMAWSSAESTDQWVRKVTPRLTEEEALLHKKVLADIRDRGYGVWKLDESQPSLRERLSELLESADHLPHGASMSRQLTRILTMVSLQSITDRLDTELSRAEFVVIPVFGPDGRPNYQIELRLNRPLTISRLETAITAAVAQLSPARRARVDLSAS